MTSDEGGAAAASHRDHNREPDLSERKSKFKFKSKRRSQDERSRSPTKYSSSRRERSRSRDRDRERRHHHRSRRHQSSHSSSKNKDEPSLYDDTHIPNASSSQFLDPETAFRESLFDAMADDEGAQFWEGVYGQPIHTYPDVKVTEKGELERMTDEEYAAFVRAKMYEKTHQHLMEEKARREERKKERERLAREGDKEAREAEKFRQKVEESLKRGEERKKRKAWVDRWDAYTQKWETLAKAEEKVNILSIPWPVESGSKKDISVKEIERFLLFASSGGQPTESQLSKVLKVERVRWHPDKIQQKLGGQDISEDVMQAVTAVFQAIDTLWSEVRDMKK